MIVVTKKHNIMSPSAHIPRYRDRSIYHHILRACLVLNRGMITKITESRSPRTGLQRSRGTIITRGAGT